MAGSLVGAAFSFGVTRTVPPRDLFAPVLSVVLASLQVNAYKLFTQSSSFQPLSSIAE